MFAMRSSLTRTDAPNDEYFSTWYEINEIITWGFGLRKKIAFKGVFHDQPYGLQSHVYAPFGVDLRNKYSIGGNQPSISHHWLQNHTGNLVAVFLKQSEDGFQVIKRRGQGVASGGFGYSR